jgi:hypothetical protein
MPEITQLSQDDLEQQIKNGIQRIGKCCKEPMMLIQIEELSQLLLTKFVEYCDNTRLLQTIQKENVTL